MSKVCPLTGKRPVTGHNVSHSQRHTKRRWEPNLIKVTFTDEFGRKTRMRICAKALRTLNKSPRVKNT
ncbi:MAG: 50S ribosomal protein L28 [bacterium]|nr:50S ribosomal protein L28 [bacterium]